MSRVLIAQTDRSQLKNKEKVVKKFLFTSREGDNASKKRYKTRPTGHRSKKTLKVSVFRPQLKPPEMNFWFCNNFYYFHHFIATLSENEIQQIS